MEMGIAVTEGVTKWGYRTGEMELRNADSEALCECGNTPKPRIKPRIRGVWKQETALPVGGCAKYNQLKKQLNQS